MFFSYQNMTIYYEKHGIGKKVIIILPGWGDTRETFSFLIKYFQDKYTIYIVDYPGFGNSPLPTSHLSIDDYGALFFEFFNYLSIQKPIIIAHSFGGRIVSLIIGKHHYPVDKIILFDVAGIKRRKKIKIILKERTYKFLKILISFLPLKRKDKWKNILLSLFASSDYQALPVSMYKTFQNIIKKDLRSYYKKIKTETLLIWGENDNDTPLKDGFYLKKHITKSELIIYKNAAHYSYLAYPYLTIKVLEKFI